MNVEGQISDLNAIIICYCNANNRGALSASSLLDMGYSNATFISGGKMAYCALSQG